MPLPVNLKVNFYVHILRRSKQAFYPSINAYGLTLSRTNSLADLLVQLDGMVKLMFKYVICEISQSKIYRTYQE